MIVLDTNVVSEAMRPAPYARVIAWIDSRPASELFLTAPGLAEILSGISMMPDGRRKRELESATANFLASLFGERLLDFDRRAAECYARIAGDMRSRGRAISVIDCQIAATAIAHGMKVATRDTRPFVEAGMEVVDPWAE